MSLVLAVSIAVLFAASERMVKDRAGLVLSRAYLGWWGLCLLASTLDPLGMDPVSPFTYGLLLLNVAAFTAGFVAVGRRRPLEAAGDVLGALGQDARRLAGSRGTVLALAALFAYLLRYYLRYREVLGDLGPAEARNIRYSIGTLFGSAAEMLVFNYVAEALAVGLAVGIAYALVLGSIRSWAFALAVADAVLFAGIGAGRTLVVQAGIFVLLLAMLRTALGPAPGAPPPSGAGDDPAAPPRKSLLLFVGVPVVAMAALMVYLTFARLVDVETGLDVARGGEMAGWAVEALLYNVRSYAVGPFRALDQAVAHPLPFGLQFGRLTLAALDELVGYPLRLLGYDYPIMNHVVGDRTQDVIFIGSGEFNALYTGVFRFYFDFGVAGVALFAFVLGALVRGASLRLQEAPSLATLAVLAFLFAVALLSTQTWFLASPSALVFLAGAALLHRPAAR
jgi:oligosaccharide repeat unit polymerase